MNYSKDYINQLIKNTFQNKKPPKNPKLKILYGIPGSGKGTIMKKYNLLNRNTTMINYDNIIMNNPKYIKEKKKTKGAKNLQKLYFKYRKDIYKIDNMLSDIILNKKYSLIWETTGFNVDFMYSWFHKLHKKGYTLELHIPIVSLDKVYKRVEKRARNENQEPAPKKNIKEIYDISYNNVMKLLPYLDNIYIYENETKLEKAIKITSIYKIECLQYVNCKTLNLIKKIFPDILYKAIISANNCQNKCKKIKKSISKNYL